jgi:hypothetical protein
MARLLAAGADPNASVQAGQSAELKGDAEVKRVAAEQIATVGAGQAAARKEEAGWSCENNVREELSRKENLVVRPVARAVLEN